MSLNGLDHVKVVEAYQGALAEAGGWFLLKYTSRDAVEVLNRGAGGAADARGAIARYEDKSPLYGFLLYRRRKVLIKYVPEGTSRLLQARVAVHFTAVEDKFTPHDTCIAIASADELSDAALASACSLHTAAPSSSSSSSSSQLHRLHDITEDAEEGHSTAGESAVTAKPPTVLPVMREVEPPAEKEASKKKESAEGKRAPELSYVTIETVSERGENAGLTTAPVGKTLKHYDALFEDGPDPRASSQTARPALSDLYAEIYEKYNKPKVRLGPRPKAPKASLDMKRPSTSGSAAPAPTKAVSSLPSGLRVANRKPESKRPKSRDSSTVPSIAFPPPPPIPNLEIPLTPGYAPRSPVSVRSMPVHTYSSSQHGSKRGDPGNGRLMKALELQKKKMKAKKEQEMKEAEAIASSLQDGAQVDAEAAETTNHGSLPVEAKKKEEAEELTPSGGESSATQEKVEGVPSTQDSATAESEIRQVVEEDSATELASSRTETDDMHSAASASSPISAQTHGSSCAPSTRPSSMSEDDHQLRPDEQKPEVQEELVPAPEETSKEDEEASIESTPTVVLRNTTPIPVVEIEPAEEGPTILPQSSASDDALNGRSKRESVLFMSRGELDDVRTYRKSKRESALFMSPPDHQELAESRKQKRASMIVSSPTGINIQEKERRRGTIDLVQFSAENSEAEYLSDDSFMEELQSAKFEEAMPVSVSVSKSPITPWFSKASISETSIPKRSASHVVTTGRPQHEIDTQPGSRKTSGLWLPHANSDTVVTAKKINVSSGISQRIKALAEKSNRDSIASIQPQPLSREQSRQTVYNIQQEPEKPESVQVTARIIRDPQVQKPTLTMPTQTTPLDLRQSAITIDHQKSARPPSTKQSIKADPTSPIRPTSSSLSKDANMALPRSSSETSWRSFGRRMSESRPGPPPRSHSAHSVESSDEKETKKERKESRASKLFKRMSTMPSAKSRKNSIASSMLSEEELPSTLPSLREPPSPIEIGDLNIQFPDTLLWKRRYVEIDVSGNLVLRPSKANELSNGVTKRFHLTEVRAPYAPDQDRQELPNSVVFDFIDGRTLQCACETYSAQAHVLQILREAHDAWRAYGQGQ